MIFDKVCTECGDPILTTKRSDTVHCSVKCRMRKNSRGRNAQVLAWKRANPDRRSELEKQSYQRNRDKRLKQSKKHYNETLSYQKKRKNEYNQKLKRTVINAYGGKCYCCSEEILELLTLDHINQDGASHRRSLGSGRSKVYRWARDNNYPNTLRVACWSCNAGAYLNGGTCPHKQELTLVA